MTAYRKRPPPAYLVYASDDLAKSSYYGLSVSERGLLDSMQRVAWVEEEIPKDAGLLARVVRLPEQEVRESLSKSVLAHFEDAKDRPGFLRSIELGRQMENIRESREAMSTGGKKGAQTTNRTRTRESARRAAAESTCSRYLVSDPAGYGARSDQGPDRNEVNGSETKRTTVFSEKRAKSGDLGKHSDWIDDFEHGQSTPEF
jgi:hypothetical protein